MSSLARMVFKVGRRHERNRKQIQEGADSSAMPPRPVLATARNAISSACETGDILSYHISRSPEVWGTWRARRLRRLIQSRPKCLEPKSFPSLQPFATEARTRARVPTCQHVWTYAGACWHTVCTMQPALTKCWWSLPKHLT